MESEMGGAQPGILIYINTRVLKRCKFLPWIPQYSTHPLSELSEVGCRV